MSNAAENTQAGTGRADVPWETEPVPEVKHDKDRYAGMAGSTAIALYHPGHPSVLFARLNKGLRRGFKNSRFARALGAWMGQAETAPPSLKSRIVGREGGRRLLDSGLIIPSQRDVFLLSQSGSRSGYLIEENKRLRDRVAQLERAAQ
ncbi:hypothetical protein [Parerythrobacter jejuensis]|uniref:Uncharacterized protein n=1 Tax=Parerythrobacter jejuensis TaxID=795812 RepID=A0A845AU33_9SPHN|nr:hypothetical protein [Parerythrobacter jejuensis]MXP32331.1 hypothetical protein [Parerythrobacter jejuensis]